MLERIYLETFKASRDVSVRLAPLTVLTGLNSSGKSSLLQAIGVLRQSYDANARTNGLSLSGQLVHLGKYGDVLSEDAEGDAVAITISEDGITNRWVFRGKADANQLQFDDAPADAPTFVKSPHFQFLQADRIVPQTLYSQAPQQARDAGFLGPHGEYTVDFLSMAASRPVSRTRTFPRTVPGINDELLVSCPVNTFT